MTDHTQDDWYMDSGMFGPQVRVQNGGKRLSMYPPTSVQLNQARYPDELVRSFLSDMDSQWKSQCAEIDAKVAK